MASGCLSNSSTLKGCTVVTSDKCVKYTGPGIPSLNVCTNDTLLETETTILNTILTLLDGTGITLDDITTCTQVATALGSLSPTLPNFIQVLSDLACNVQSEVDAITIQINTPVVYDLNCLTTPAVITTPNVLQEVINLLCTTVTSVNNLTASILSTGNTVNSTVNDLPTTINNYAGTQILSSITSCNGGYGLTKTGSGTTANISIDALVPPFSAFFVWNPTTIQYFDSTGKGSTGTPFCGWYIMNGNNGTVDMRGYGPAGATNLPGINGPGLQTAVDPTFNNDTTYSTNIGDRRGEYKHKITLAESPSHSHPLTVSGGLGQHTHQMFGDQSVLSANQGNIRVDQPSLINAAVAVGSVGSSTHEFNMIAATRTLYNPGDAKYGTTSYASGGEVSVTMTAVGGDQVHENRQPTIYGFWITRLA